jgi:hypothetical protein
VREELDDDDEEIEGATFWKGVTSGHSVVRGGGGRVSRKGPASDGRDKRRGELGMSSWMKTGFSKETEIMRSSFRGDLEGSSSQIRMASRCKRWTDSLQRVAPRPRYKKGSINSRRIMAPAPRLVIID